jgi:hypothetical protein
MSAEYQKAHQAYRKAVAENPKDKAKAMNEIRNIERANAREGKILSAIYRGDTVVVETKDAPSKRDLQGEYIRKFDAAKTVPIGGKEQTLREYHTKRLLKR